MPETPRYEHDCSPEHGCEFIAQLDDDDIWFHADQNCIIYRHSSDGPDYGTFGLEGKFSFVHFTSDEWEATCREMQRMVIEHLTRQHTEEMGIL